MAFRNTGSISKVVISKLRSVRSWWSRNTEHAAKTNFQNPPVQI